LPDAVVTDIIFIRTQKGDPYGPPAYPY
jgi:hypothetical protein